jgi:hypothetical protein
VRDFVRTAPSALPDPVPCQATFALSWRVARLLGRVVLDRQNDHVAEGVQVPDIDDDEAGRLLRIVRRGTGSVVIWRRAQMVLLSAQRMPVAKIAEVTFTSADRVQAAQYCSIVRRRSRSRYSGHGGRGDRHRPAPFAPLRCAASARTGYPLSTSASWVRELMPSLGNAL